MDLREIEDKTGLVFHGPIGPDELPVFVHERSGQQFVLIPSTTFVMGMTRRELIAALRELSYDPSIDKERHRQTYERANPAHPVAVPSFLCGRTPLLARAVAESRTGVSWSTHETSEQHGATVAAAMSFEDAATVLDHYSWSLPTEAQWECVARCGRDTWAGGPHYGAAVESQVHDPRFSEDAAFCNDWGIWGLGLGEWIADAWHESYVGAPSDGSAWIDGRGQLGATRGGGVLHAPWQDRAEAMSCHAAARGGLGDWRGVFTARPVIWVDAPRAAPTASDLSCPAYVRFDDATTDLEREIRDGKLRRQERQAAQNARFERLRRELPGSIQKGRVRFIGADGVYIVELADSNAILRDARGIALRVGDEIVVRVVGEGGVPEVEVV